MEPTNAAQHAAAMARAVPERDEFRDGIWSLPIPIAAGAALTHSFCYAITDSHGDVHLFDPGTNSDDNFERLLAGLAAMGSSIDRVATVTASHLHPDHLGMAGRVRAASGASVAMGAVEQVTIDLLSSGGDNFDTDALVDRWGVPADRRDEVSQTVRFFQRREGFTADRVLNAGDELPIPGRTLRVLVTPGHTDGHICLVDAEESIAYTGDHLLPVMFPGLGLGSSHQLDPIGDYFESLDELESHGDLEVAPGHWFRFRGLVERTEQTRSRHLRRGAEVAAEWESDPSATVWQIASQLHWTAGWENMHGFPTFSALRQVDMHLGHLSRLDATT